MQLIDDNGGMAVLVGGDGQLVRVELDEIEEDHQVLPLDTRIDGKYLSRLPGGRGSVEVVTGGRLVAKTIYPSYYAAKRASEAS
jgi:hypothetical protein